MPTKRVYRKAPLKKRVVKKRVVAPRKRVVTVRKKPTRRMKGGAVLTWLRKAHDFIKKNKLVSRIGNSLGSRGVPYAGAIGKAGAILGYGLKRGGSLRLAGGALVKKRVVKKSAVAPRKRVVTVRKKPTRRMKGSGVLDWLRKAHDFIKKNKLVSRIGNSLGAMGVPYAGAIGKAGGVLGYGRKRGSRGGALRLAGGSRIMI